ncbi:glycosyltransferase family 2 protein [Planctomycetes bacterium Pan216]
MYQEKRIAVVIPAKDEAHQIEQVLRTVPSFVDAVFLIDDGSTDGTAATADSIASALPFVLEVIRHERNRGKGIAVATGYRRAREERYDITVVMDGDGQMDAVDFEPLIRPIAEDRVEYTKGNRFAFPGGLAHIPRLRKLGNFVLSMMTKVASGYWHVSDSQCGYTAISLLALDALDLDRLYPTYGCPNDVLIKLNIANMRVGELPVRPLYNVGERSKMRISRVVLPILRLLLLGFLGRLVVKYTLMSGHPLVLVYLAGLALVAMLAPLGLYLTIMLLITALLRRGALIIAGFCFVAGINLLVGAIAMDADANRHLCVHFSPRELARFRSGQTK